MGQCSIPPIRASTRGDTSVTRAIRALAFGASTSLTARYCTAVPSVAMSHTVRETMKSSCRLEHWTLRSCWRLRYLWDLPVLMIKKCVTHTLCLPVLLHTTVKVIHELIPVKLGRHPAGRHPVMLSRSIPLTPIYPENPTACDSSVFHEGGALSTSECETSQLRIRAWSPAGTTARQFLQNSLPITTASADSAVMTSPLKTDCVVLCLHLQNGCIRFSTRRVDATCHVALRRADATHWTGRCNFKGSVGAAAIPSAQLKISAPPLLFKTPPRSTARSLSIFS